MYHCVIPSGTTAGTATLRTYEIARNSLLAGRADIRPFDSAKGFKGRPVSSQPANLTIHASELMLTAAKTELARSFTFADANEQAFSLWIRMRPQLIMDGQEFRLTPARIFQRKDASANFDASRIGEGVAHLFMAARGYVYWDHLPTLLEATLTNRTMNHGDQTKNVRFSSPIASKHPAEEPDFICQARSGAVALLECKGSFTKEGSPRHDTITTVLKKGLRQLANWGSAILPTAQKEFAVGTFLRHDGDNSGEPGMIAWADPPSKRSEPVPAFEIPSDAIIRGHYGCLLALLGFVSEGRALRLRTQRTPIQRRVLISTINKRKYVVAPHLFFPWDLGFSHIFFGLKLDLFETFARSLENPDVNLEPAEIVPENIELDGILARALADGAIVGERSGGSSINDLSAQEIRLLEQCRALALAFIVQNAKRDSPARRSQRDECECACWASSP